MALKSKVVLPTPQIVDPSRYARLIEGKVIIAAFKDIWERSGTEGVSTAEANALIARAEAWMAQIELEKNSIEGDKKKC